MPRIDRVHPSAARLRRLLRSKRKTRRNRRPLMENLESRLMLDGDLWAAVTRVEPTGGVQHPFLVSDQAFVHPLV